MRSRLAKSERLAVFRRLLRNPKGALGTAFLAFVILIAIFSPWIAPYNPVELHLRDQFAPPSTKYFFGADELGRDIFSRVISATPIALQAGLLAVMIAAVVGVLSGLVAGYVGGAVDAIIMRIWDTLLAFPAIFLAIGIVTILGPGWANAVLAIAIINMPVFARLVRALTLSVKGKDFVEAAMALGCSQWHIMLRTILPNCIAPLMVQMAIAAPSAILVEASLSYLGLGSQPPAPSWGNMLSAAQGYLARSATYGIFPGLAITLVVIGMNYFADGLQDALDPRRTFAGARMR
ncbi:MAG: ABC transporter permease [Chloroflexi bacterium]|nr:ABC transporter permease [Chloroflexota bacterium]